MRVPLPLVVLAACSGCPPKTPVPPPVVAVTPVPAVILVSIDGLRRDLLDRWPTPALDRIAAGVQSAGLQPPFPSSTLPSHYTMATGLEPGEHGIISNVFWDPVRQDQFRLGDSEDMTDGSWWGGTPIWNHAESAGITSATLFWPGSEADIGGRQATTWLPYDSSLPNAARVDTVLGWLTRETERPGFVTLYFGTVDKAGHRYGPMSDEVGQALVEVDAQLGRLLDGLASRGLTASTDLVVVSDHGMAPLDRDRVVDLSAAGVDLSSYRVADSSPVLQIHEVGDTSEALAATLDAVDHLSCHTRDQTPASWHYRHRAVGDVVCLADRGWSIAPRGITARMVSRVLEGSHGWDPTWPAMHGVFLATGPRVADGVALPVVRASEVHAAVCGLLGIEPAEGAAPAPWLDRFLVSETSP